MRFPPGLLVLTGLWLVCWEVTRAGTGGTLANADEKALASAGLTADGPALLEFFRERTRLDNDSDRLKALVQELNHPKAEVRERSVKALVARGPVAIPALRQAVNDLTDAARAKHARFCLQHIEGPGGAAVVAAAARLLAVRQPDGAVEILLAYVPFADDDGVTAAARQALAALAYPDRKAHSALVRALRDPLPIRRAVAAEALCQTSHPEQWPGLRGLLRDPNQAVRIRTALTLAKEHDPDSIPMVIDHLDEMEPVQRGAAEGILVDLAGESPRKVSSGTGARFVEKADWATWWRTNDGPALLAVFRKWTLTMEDEARIRDLIRGLGDSTFAVRKQASADLVARGAPAMPLLRAALKGSDLERYRRIELCLQKISESADQLPVAAPRLLALRKPAGATEALLAYLPNADDETMRHEVVTALATLAVRDREQHPTLVRAMKDPHPARREAAAVALTQADVAALRPAVRRLLTDEQAAVRVGVALALAAAGERDTVNVLLDALTGAPLEEGWRAHESLLVLAGDKAPAAGFGDDAGARTKCGEAWQRWWREHGASANLAKLAAPRFLGYTLIVSAAEDGKGRVREVGRDGRVRWQIDNLLGPADAHLLPGGRVLIAEGKALRVTERNLKGDILWQVQGLNSSPTNVQRLANGHTLIATEVEILVVDGSGKPVLRRDFQGAGVFGAAQTRNGDTFCFLEGGTCFRVNSAGKTINNFPSGRNSFFRGGIDVLPNGHILITQPNQNAVVEVDGEGKTYRRIEVPGVTAASCLPDGHILAACCEAHQVTELDGRGRVVWTYKDEFRPSRARRR